MGLVTTNLNVITKVIDSDHPKLNHILIITWPDDSNVLHLLSLSGGGGGGGGNSNADHPSVSRARSSVVSDTYVKN